MKRQGRDADGFFYGIMAQELREIYPNVVKSSGLAVELDENEEDEEKIEQNHWYVEKDRLAELALGGVKDLYTISKEKEVALDSLINRNQALEIEVETLRARWLCSRRAWPIRPHRRIVSRNSRNWSAKLARGNNGL